MIHVVRVLLVQNPRVQIYLGSGSDGFMDLSWFFFISDVLLTVLLVLIQDTFDGSPESSSV